MIICYVDAAIRQSYNMKPGNRLKLNQFDSLGSNLLKFDLVRQNNRFVKIIMFGDFSSYFYENNSKLKPVRVQSVELLQIKSGKIS